MKQIILEIVNNCQGIKAVDLALKVMERVGPANFDSLLYQNKVEELIMFNEIMEIKYVLPSLKYRVKSFYLPKGTKVTV